MEKEYRLITNKYLANAIAYITQERYYVFSDGYSFKNTEKFNKAFGVIQNLKKSMVK